MPDDDSNFTDDEDEEGPSMGEGGAMPSGSDTGWQTSQPNPDATKPETMPSSSKED